MTLTVTTGSKSRTGWLQSQGLIGIVAAAFVLALALPVSAQTRARLSRDLVTQLDRGVDSSSVDVIVSGTTAFVDALVQRHGAAVKKQLKHGAVLSVTPAGLRSLAADGDAGAVTADGIVRSHLALVTESTGAARAWAGEIEKLGAVVGTGVGIAIIDSGIDNHTALAGRVVASVDFTRRAGKAADDYGHGTHVAGIAAAGLPGHDTGEQPVGMAPGAHLINLKVIDGSGTGTASAAIGAIDWAVDHRDRFAIRIINLSLGMAATQSWQDDPLCQAVERAVRAGIVVVASAGNQGQTPEGKTVLGSVRTSPGISPYAITVGALRTNGTVERDDDYVAPWSSKGPTRDGLIKPDIVAPGSKVVSLLATNSTLARAYPERRVLGHGRNGYFELSGTSQAAAVVSGAAALLLQSKPGLKPLQVKVLLQASAEFVPEAGLVSGGGTVNLARTDC